MKEHTIFIDGNNIAWMAFGRAPLEYNSQRTEVIKIMLAMVRAYLAQFEPMRIIIIWDGGRDGRRIQIYPDYKYRLRERTETERAEREIFFAQVDQLREIFQGLGVLQYRVENREADDVIYNLLRFGIQGSEEVVVISSDRDMFQLMEERRMQIFNPIKKCLLTIDDVEQMLGIPIQYYSLYRAIVGDASDNVPGVKGIGPVRGARMVRVIAGKEELQCSDQYHLEAIAQGVQRHLDLICFLPIKREELEKGRIEAELDESKIYQYFVDVCKRYGLHQMAAATETFLEPFILQNKRIQKRSLEHRNHNGSDWILRGPVNDEEKKKLQEFANSVSKGFYGRTLREAQEERICAMCGEEAGDFKDELSEREYEISGFCQECQDEIFEGGVNEVFDIL